MNKSRSRITPKASATNVRLDSTVSESSPTCPPRLRLAKSPTLEPPLAEVKPQSTPRRSVAGICSRQWNTQFTLAEPAHLGAVPYPSITPGVQFGSWMVACSGASLLTLHG